MGSLAIIPARGGSKRIPRKNIREFHGRPILAYSILAALESDCFDTIMVSTDDEEIASVARSWGALVPFMRSEEASGDKATTATVLSEVLKEWKSRDRTFDAACCIYPTAPFLTGAKIRDAYHQYRDAGAKSLMSVVRFDFPIQRALTLRDGRTSFWMPEHKQTRSQDLEPMFHDAGQMYWFDAANCLETGQFLTEDCLGYELGDLEVQDIDNENDWKLAELKYSLLMPTQQNE